MFILLLLGNSRASNMVNARQDNVSLTSSSDYLSKAILHRDKKQYYWLLILTQGTCYENLTIFQTYKMNNEWIKFSCLAENILTTLNPCTIRLSLFYRQPFKNTGILNYDRFIQDFAERSIATVFVCRTGAKRFKEGRIFYKFEIFTTPRTACLSTYKYFCPPNLCSGIRDVSQPFTEKEKIDYPRKN